MFVGKRDISAQPFIIFGSIPQNWIRRQKDKIRCSAFSLLRPFLSLCAAERRHLWEGYQSEVDMRRAAINRPPTPDVEEEEQQYAGRREPPSIQEIVNIKLIESGEKESLKELLRERLIECGWRDEMKALCRAYARKKGRNNVTVDDLVHIITPKGRASIPDAIKAELLQRIRSFLVAAAI